MKAQESNKISEKQLDESIAHTVCQEDRYLPLFSLKFTAVIEKLTAPGTTPFP